MKEWYRLVRSVCFLEKSGTMVQRFEGFGGLNTYKSQYLTFIPQDAEAAPFAAYLSIDIHILRCKLAGKTQQKVLWI